jgi:hypothetical protein
MAVSFHMSLHRRRMSLLRRLEELDRLLSRRQTNRQRSLTKAARLEVSRELRLLNLLLNGRPA